MTDVTAAIPSAAGAQPWAIHWLRASSMGSNGSTFLAIVTPPYRAPPDEPPDEPPPEPPPAGRRGSNVVRLGPREATRPARVERASRGDGHGSACVGGVHEPGRRR